MKIIFTYNKRKDVWNWWYACNYSSIADWRKEIGNNIFLKIKGKTLQEAKSFIMQHLEKVYEEQNPLKIKKEISKKFDKIQDLLIKRIEDLTRKPFYYQTLKVYITTFPRGPYGDGWIMVFVKHSIEQSLTSIAHEFLHFQFHAYYEEKFLKAGINKEKINDVKESLTVLLNEEFQEILPKKDWGYEQHKELRSKIVKYWREKKDINLLLDKLLDDLKYERN